MQYRCQEHNTALGLTLLLLIKTNNLGPKKKATTQRLQSVSKSRGIREGSQNQKRPLTQEWVPWFSLPALHGRCSPSTSMTGEANIPRMSPAVPAKEPRSVVPKIEGMKGIWEKERWRSKSTHAAYESTGVPGSPLRSICLGLTQSDNKGFENYDMIWIMI